MYREVTPCVIFFLVSERVLWPLLRPNILLFDSIFTRSNIYKLIVGRKVLTYSRKYFLFPRKETYPRFTNKRSYVLANYKASWPSFSFLCYWQKLFFLTAFDYSFELRNHTRTVRGSIDVHVHFYRSRPKKRYNTLIKTNRKGFKMSFYERNHSRWANIHFQDRYKKIFIYVNCPFTIFFSFMADFNWKWIRI